MTSLEHLAYTSNLRKFSPACKAAAALATMVVCLGISQILFSIVIFIFMSLLCTLASGVSVRRYSLMCSIPFGFLLIGVVTVAVFFSKTPMPFFSIPFLGNYLVVTESGLLQAAELFFRSMACISCLYFLCVTTPITHILGLLERLHAPRLLVELMLMIYRFIFILAELAACMSVAQKSRLGGAGFRTATRSLAALMSTLFIRALQKSGKIYDAMESRGYDGRIPCAGGLPASDVRQRVALTLYFVLLAVCAVVANWIAG